MQIVSSILNKCEAEISSYIICIKVALVDFCLLCLLMLFLPRLLCLLFVCDSMCLFVLATKYSHIQCVDLGLPLFTRGFMYEPVIEPAKLFFCLARASN